MTRSLATFVVVLVVILAGDAPAKEAATQLAATPQSQDHVERIAFLGEDGLCTINPDGTGLRRISGRDYMPVTWSTDRKSIYLTRYYDPKDPELYERAKWSSALIDADGTNLRERTEDEARALGLSPDGKLRLFTKGMGSVQPNKVYVQNADGTGTRLLTPGTPEYGPGELRMSPQWSHDGSKVCYVAGEPFKGFDVYLVHPDGSSPTACTHGRRCETVLRYSPCEDKILFSTTKEANRDIHVVDADGKNEINLTKHPAEEGGWFDWSPDGQRVVFSSNRDGDWELFVVNADGTGLRQITLNDVDDGCPAWQSVRVLPEGVEVRQARAAATTSAGELGRRETERFVVRSLRIWRAHESGFPSVALSPDGRLLAAASPIGKQVNLWDVETGERVRTLAEPWGQATTSMAFSPDGGLLACAGTHWGIRLWEADSGKLLRTLYEMDPNTGEMIDASALAFSPNGAELAVTLEGQPKKGEPNVRFLNVATGEEVRAIKGDHAARITDIAFSPNGEWVATASEDQNVKLWEAATGRLVRTLAGHQGAVTAVAASADGRLLASVSNDRTVRLWDVSTGRQIATLSESAYPGPGVAFVGGRAVAFRSGSGIHLVEAGTHQELCTISPETSSSIGCLTISADGGRLAVIDKGGMAQVWSIACEEAPPALDTSDSAPGIILRPLAEGPLFSPRWSLDGRFLCATRREDDESSQVVVLSTADGHVAGSFSGSDPVWDPSGAPTREEWGEIFCYEEGERGGLYSYVVGGVGVVGRRICDHGWKPIPSPDGRKLLFGPVPGQAGLAVVSVADGVVTEVSRASSSPLATWSPDGREIAYSLPVSLPELRGIYLVPTGGGSGRRWLPSGDTPRWSPDGAQIAFVRGNELCLASYPEGTVTLLSRDGPFTDPVWSPDGRWLAWARAKYDEAEKRFESDGIVAVRTATRQQIEISEFGMAPQWSGDGRLLAFDGRPKEGLWVARLVPPQVLAAAERDPEVGRYWWWQWAIADLSEPTTTPKSQWGGVYSRALEKGWIKPGAREIRWEPVPQGGAPPRITPDEACRIAEDFLRRHPGRCGLEGGGPITQTDRGPSSVLMLGRDQQGHQYLARHLLVFAGSREELFQTYFPSPEGPAPYGTMNRGLAAGIGEVWVNAEDGSILSARTGEWLPADSARWGRGG